jgi:hypothetical protein
MIVDLLRKLLITAGLLDGGGAWGREGRIGCVFIQSIQFNNLNAYVSIGDMH